MYYVYIVECSDGSFYSGITTDLKRRIAEHNDSKLGARYTSSRRPVKMIYSASFKNRSEASAEEFRIKKLTKAQKLALVLG